MFKVNNKGTRTTPLTYSIPFSGVSVVDFEQVNIYWAEGSPHKMLNTEFVKKEKKMGKYFVKKLFTLSQTIHIIHIMQNIFHLIENVIEKNILHLKCVML